MKAEPKTPDRLTEDELAAHHQPFYTPGVPYQWILPFGWVVVGFYVRHENPLTIRVAHANYYGQAGKTHAALALEGGGSETTWRYMGGRLIPANSFVSVGIYNGEVPRGPILS